MSMQHACEAFEAGVREALELFKTVDLSDLRAKFADSAERVLDSMEQVVEMDSRQGNR